MHSPSMLPTTCSLIETGLELLRDPAFNAIEMVHQIMKHIVTMAIATPECQDLARFFNLKAELVNHASLRLGASNYIEAWLV